MGPYFIKKTNEFKEKMKGRKRNVERMKENRKQERKKERKNEKMKDKRKKEGGLLSLFCLVFFVLNWDLF